MSRRHAVSESEQREWLRRNVRARRAELGITAQAASARVMMSLSHWQRVEAGTCNPTLATLVNLSTALGVKVPALLRKPAAPTSGGRPTLGIGIKIGSVPTEAMVREWLAVKVRALRTKRELTLKVASRRASLAWRHWQKIEAGEVNATLQTLVRVALSLGVDPADLFSA